MVAAVLGRTIIFDQPVRLPKSRGPQKRTRLIRRVPTRRAQGRPATTCAAFPVVSTHLMAPAHTPMPYGRQRLNADRPGAYSAGTGKIHRQKAVVNSCRRPPNIPYEQAGFHFPVAAYSRDRSVAKNFRMLTANRLRAQRWDRMQVAQPLIRLKVERRSARCIHSPRWPQCITPA